MGYWWGLSTRVDGEVRVGLCVKCMVWPDGRMVAGKNTIMNKYSNAIRGNGFQSNTCKETRKKRWRKNSFESTSSYLSVAEDEKTRKPFYLPHRYQYQKFPRLPRGRLPPSSPPLPTMTCIDFFSPLLPSCPRFPPPQRLCHFSRQRHQQQMRRKCFPFHRISRRQPHPTQMLPPPWQPVDFLAILAVRLSSVLAFGGE